jgi:hypothetical protein
VPSQHKAPMLGWHPPAGLSAWARAEAERRGVPLSVILTEALAAAKEKAEAIAAASVTV